ncbi:MAG: tetratricopeptide repeat protein [Phenylobacterium sp.]|uniref:tetratricopeptide repeat protein n=1 Tax=Phenylobacterium sp. TaxID=1871053 RepID=UPI001B63FFB9|nr:tetratricopeptide repeat protein [Phenylobacterium sp.]MBP7817949.1 tetratricopeptide repeat protein [Phenylobacterium sp.]MBP9230191.1 tetratricopeptide repeat protein [Phenylobacterium sp.]MBP9755877.1 tetratricopeptide repeat protein [Phenylobacterium sp.]
MSAFARALGLPPTDAASLKGDGGSGAPTSLVALTRYGLERQARGDFQAAVEAFRAVADAAPRQALVWNNLALALGGLGDHEQAAVALRKSLDIDATQVSAWVSLAAALLQLGRPEDAENACDGAIARDPDIADAWQIRAMVLAGRDDFVGAAAAFSRTIEIAGENGALRANLGVTLFKSGAFHEAQRNFDAAMALEADADEIVEMARLCRFVVAGLDGDMARVAAISRELAGAAEADTLFKTALLCLDWAGHKGPAALIGQTWASLRPGNLEARHMADAAMGRPVERQPAAFVAQHFDGMAEQFDEKLVGRLGYRGPEEIRALMADWMQPDGSLDVLDMGCGTGLCGPVLRPYALRLIGVDLSDGMLAKAREGGLYDELRCADLVDTLRQPGARWDMIVAGDTFPYVGTLGDVFDGAAKALKPGGWLIFSTEAAEGDGVTLRGNGRYAHGRGYMADLAAGRFEIIERRSTMLRREAGVALEGDYFLMRKL